MRVLTPRATNRSRHYYSIFKFISEYCNIANLEVLYKTSTLSICFLTKSFTQEEKQRQYPSFLTLDGNPMDI